MQHLDKKEESQSESTKKSGLPTKAIVQKGKRRQARRASLEERKSISGKWTHKSLLEDLNNHCFTLSLANPAIRKEDRRQWANHKSTG